jgi:hypothetical protein
LSFFLYGEEEVAVTEYTKFAELIFIRKFNLWTSTVAIFSSGQNFLEKKIVSAPLRPAYKYSMEWFKELYSGIPHGHCKESFTLTNRISGARLANFTKFLINNPANFLISLLSGILLLVCPLTYRIFLITPKRFTNFTSYKEYPTKFLITKLLTQVNKILIQSR